jgi:hypothetical protein
VNELGDDRGPCVFRVYMYAAQILTGDEDSVVEKFVAFC